MIAIPGGKFIMGSPDYEPFRKKDEGPLRKVALSKFWMAKTEVTWDEYMAFFRATGSQGRTEGQVVLKKNVDAILTISETSKKDICRFFGVDP